MHDLEIILSIYLFVASDGYNVRVRRSRTPLDEIDNNE